MKILRKIIYCCIILIIISNVMGIFNYEVHAAKDYKQMMDEATGFINKGKTEFDGSNIKVDEITAQFKPLGQILTMIGAGVMVAVTTYMGIKYLTSGPDAQAKLKQQLVGVIVSGIVIFGAYGIWSLVGKIAMTFDS